MDIARVLERFVLESSESELDSLPQELQDLIDQYIARDDGDVERRRTRWDDHLRELLGRLQHVDTPRSLTLRMTALLLILDACIDSSTTGDSDLIPARSTEAFWWPQLLKPVILGDGFGASSNSDARRPVVVLRAGLNAALSASSKALVRARFSTEQESWLLESILEDYADRFEVQVYEPSEQYAAGNLQECLVRWAEAFPKAFFDRVGATISSSREGTLPHVALLLRFLSQSAGKAYHAIDTPAIHALLDLALAHDDSAILELCAQCMAIFLVSLPVIIGRQNILSAICLFAKLAGAQVATGSTQGSERLFTTLYAMYPKNFLATMRNLDLWRDRYDLGPTASIQEACLPMLRTHTLTPYLFEPGDENNELSDLTRWRNMDSGDVAAFCDRNRVQGAATDDSYASHRRHLLDVMRQPGTSLTAQTVSPPMGEPSTNEACTRCRALEQELVMLRAESHFQAFLKSTHLAHMGAVHRARVLDSAMDVEQQSLNRSIRNLRSQLSAAQAVLDKARAENATTRVNWTSHIDDLREKVKTHREQRLGHEGELEQLRSRVAELQELVEQQSSLLAEKTHNLLDLENTVSHNAARLDQVQDLERRIERLLETLAICDEDLMRIREEQEVAQRLSKEAHSMRLMNQALVNRAEEAEARNRELETLLQARPASASILEAKDALQGAYGENVKMQREIDRLRQQIQSMHSL